MTAIQELRLEYPLAMLLEIAQLPRATFYYHLKRSKNPDKYESAKEEIRAIYHENKGRYGYRRITTELHKRNISLNHKTVQRLMKEMGVICRVRMKKYRSYKGEIGKVAPNLLERNFYAERPNQKWVTDVTEFHLFGEKLYLSPILDLHSRDIVSYVISERPVLSMVTSMLEKALSTLSDVQRSRIYKHFFLQMTYSEISKEEGVNRSSIRESIEQTLKKLKKFYE